MPFEGLQWPGGGSAIWQRQQAVIQRAAAERLRRFPDSPHTAAQLLQAHRMDEALGVISLVIQRQPERLAEALQGLDTSEMQRDQSHGYKARAQALLGEARKKLLALDRERAADMAWAMVTLEAAAATEYEAYEVRLERFLAAYDGTEMATLLKVDQITRGRLTLAMLSDLDALAASAPGTAAAAKARYMKAFHLAHNRNNLVLAGADPDPTDSFLRAPRSGG